MTDAPLVSVVVSGRAAVLADTMRLSDAVLWAGYAGVAGPRAVAVALAGERPTGRMPVTLPSDSHAVPVRHNDRQSAAGVYTDIVDPVLVSYGDRADDSVRPDPVGASWTVASDGLLDVTMPTQGEPPSGGVPLFATVRDGVHTPRLRQVVSIGRADADGTLRWRIPARFLSADGIGPLDVTLLCGDDPLLRVRVDLADTADGPAVVDATQVG